MTASEEFCYLTTGYIHSRCAYVSGSAAAVNNKTKSIQSKIKKNEKFSIITDGILYKTALSILDENSLIRGCN